MHTEWTVQRTFRSPPVLHLWVSDTGFCNRYLGILQHLQSRWPLANCGRKLQRVNFTTSRPLLASVKITKSSHMAARWNIHPSVTLKMLLSEKISYKAGSEV